jgi:transcriptional regulator with XRE-family HTH domain
MIKQKLIDKRKERNLTQDDMAYRVGIETSGYNRRENGITRISKREWDKFAKALDVELKEIYEPEDGVYIFHSENTTGNIGNNNVFNDFSDYAVETMKKYIIKLEEENQTLKDNLKKYEE